MKKMLLGFLVLCLIGGVTAAYVEKTAPKTAQAAATMPTAIMPSTPPPGMQTKVLDWSGKAVADILTFDNQNANAHFRHTVAHYFTDDGYDNFIDAVHKAKLIDSVQSYQQTVHAALPTPAKYVNYGILQAAPVWEIEVPAAVDYVSSSATRKENLNIKLRVTASPLDQEDFRIIQWIAATQ
jgi:hypothetical protein